MEEPKESADSMEEQGVVAGIALVGLFLLSVLVIAAIYLR